MRDLEEWERDPDRVEAIRRVAIRQKKRMLEAEGSVYVDAYHTISGRDVLAVLEAAAGFEAKEE